MLAGIYIHIPFCKSRCSYCDFATDIYESSEGVDKYIAALTKEISTFEIDKIASCENEFSVDTVYFGGGTPSLLTPQQFSRVFEQIHSSFTLRADVEVTLEINPGTASLEALKEFRSLGVNRASFGVQTFDDRALKLLARGHTADDARKTFELLRLAGFENVSFDLIGGLPHQTLASWERNLDEAFRLDPEHLSLYLLEVVGGTPLDEQIRTKRQPMPDEDLAGEMYDLMVKKSADSDLNQYEISNFAKPGFESRHNLKYWHCEPVFGFGVSAHSYDGKETRWSNERDTAEYVSLLETDHTPVVEVNRLSSPTRLSEFAFLNLRLNKGLNLNEVSERFGVDLRHRFREDFARFEKLGLIEFVGERLRLTKSGMRFSNEVFSVLI